MAEDGHGSSTSTMTVKFPAHGSKRGSVWNDGVHFHVKRLEIVYGTSNIYSVRIEYIDQNGEAKWGPIHGGYSCDAFTKREIIDLHCTSEFLTSIHGYENDLGINCLTFKTNKGQTFGIYDHFHEGKGTKFSNPLWAAAKIVGFHGWSDTRHLNAIGVYVQPITKYTRSMHQQQLQPVPEAEHQPEPEPKTNVDCFSLGEYGFEYGECWVENFRAIKRLVIYVASEWISGLQMDYEDENGETQSKLHGIDYGFKSEVVNLEHPDEHLVTIEGYYDNSIGTKSSTKINGSSNLILSLTVITNHKSYGPFGFQHGTRFLFPTNERLKVVGIRGRTTFWTLTAIGLIVVRTS